MSHTSPCIPTAGPTIPVLSLRTVHAVSASVQLVPSDSMGLYSDTVVLPWRLKCCLSNDEMVLRWVMHVFIFVSEVVHVYTCLHVLREAKYEYQASSSICLPSCMCMRACLCVHTYMHTSPALCSETVSQCGPPYGGHRFNGQTLGV